MSVQPTKHELVADLVQVVARPPPEGSSFLKAGEWQAGTGGGQRTEMSWSVT